MSRDIAPSILDYVGDLDQATAELANTWRPDDPAYLADLHRQTLMNLSYGYFAWFHADAEHPDWAPLWNPVYTCQPNPDDIYLYCPIRGDLTYRVSGSRGTTRRLTFSLQKALPGFARTLPEMATHMTDLDDRDLTLGPDGEVELILSAERPKGYAGDWGRIDPEADSLLVRYRSWDWAGERDPQLSIECLDPVGPKPRLAPDEIARRMRLLAQFPGNMTRVFFEMQNGVREWVGVNVFEPVRYPTGLTKQVYWPAVFELEDGEALIVETEMPKVTPYWNIQLNDPYFNAIEYVYRQSSLNGASAVIDADGRFRAVVALEDPGVPNWLDPGGFKQGTIYGRWYDTDSYPTPTIRRVPLAKLRDHLPADTPAVTPERRAEQTRARVRAAQRRRRW
jgi:hypothetical protein